MILMKQKCPVQLLQSKALPSSLLGPVPENPHVVIRQIINFISVGKKQNQKGNPSLLFKQLHKLHLMLMDILEAEGIGMTLLSIKAHRNALHRPDVVHRTLLVEVGQGDMPVLLINPDGGDGGGHLLNQSQPLLQILFICSVDQILQGGPPQASGIPGCHSAPPAFVEYHLPVHSREYPESNRAALP